MVRKPVSTIEGAGKPLWMTRRDLARAVRAENREAITSALEALLRLVCSAEHPAVRSNAERAIKWYIAACWKAGITQLEISLK